MSSNGKTPYLQLNQWVDTDPIMRVDFNADNQKIDQALNNVPIQLIADLTTTTATKQLDVDLGRPITDFQELRIHISGARTSNSGSTDKLYLRLQNQTENYMRYTSSSSTYTGSTNSLMELTCPPKSWRYSMHSLQLVIDQDMSATMPVILCGIEFSVWSSSSSQTAAARSESQTLYLYDSETTSLPPNQIHTLNFGITSATNNILPGMRIKIYGFLA